MQITQKYGKSILMEDDIVTAPGFLIFINEALEFYKDDDKILSVSGHTPNLKLLNSINSDFYITSRYHGWGTGIWKSKLDLMKRLPNWKDVKKDKKIKKKLDEFGTDIWDMVKGEALGILDAGDIRMCYLAAKNDLYNILPTQTLVRNIGLDGSGVHCGNDNIYKDDALSNKVNFIFSEDYTLNDVITKEYKNFYDKPSLLKRIKNKLTQRNKN